MCIYIYERVSVATFWMEKNSTQTHPSLLSAQVTLMQISMTLSLEMGDFRIVGCWKVVKDSDTVDGSEIW